MWRLLLRAPAHKALYLHMPNAIIAASSGVTLRERLFVPKNFKLFIVTDLKYTSDGKYILAVYCVTEPTGSLPLPPAPSKYSLYYSRTFRDSPCKFDLTVNFRSDGM